MLRLTRRLDSGIIKIRDRDKDGNEVFHVLGVKHSPTQKLVNRTRKVADPENEGEFIREPIEGDFMPAKDEHGRPVWAKYGESFEVNDEDYVMELHGGILEKC